MAVFFVYDAARGCFLNYSVSGGSLVAGASPPFTVSDFTAGRSYDAVWTDRRLILAYNSCAALYDGSFCVSGGFRRAASSRALCESPRCAGLSLCLGAELCRAERERLRFFCVGGGFFDYVSPPYDSPDCVTVSVRAEPSSKLYRGYPRLEAGSENVYVFAMQDALFSRGLLSMKPTGRFCAETAAALRRFKGECGLAPTDFADASVWRYL